MNEFQQTFLYSMLSNTAPALVKQQASGTEPTNVEAANLMQQQMAQALPGALKGLGLNASVVWGPCVYVDPADVVQGPDLTYGATATNTVVVFRSGSNYIVAIAGTKGGSHYAIFNEDSKVGVLVPWNYGSPANSSPMISTGTNDGLTHIFAMQDPGTQKTLQAFFQGISASNNFVTFTGHSLGGALAPAIALALFGSSSTLLKNRNGWTARTYATAGPDVGNGDYGRYFTGCFNPPDKVPDIPWQQYNVKIYNSCDIVPVVWSPGFVQTISTIYGSNMITPIVVFDILEAQLQNIKSHNDKQNPYVFLGSNTGKFTGTFKPVNTISPPSMVNYDCNTCSANQAVCNFAAEILFQHLDGYLIGLGLQNLIGVFAKNPVSTCKLASMLTIKKAAAVSEAVA